MNKFAAFSIPTALLSVVACSDHEEMSVPVPDSISIEALGEALPERKFLGLDPEVTTGSLWDAGLQTLEDPDDSVRELFLFPSAFEPEGAGALESNQTPPALLEGGEIADNAIEKALRSRNYDMIRLALLILERHSVPLSDTDRTADEIVQVFNSMDILLREEMNHEMNKEIWYLSPTHLGDYLQEVEALRLRTPEEEERLRLRRP